MRTTRSCDALTDDGVAALGGDGSSPALAQLILLYLSHCSNVGDRGLRGACRCPLEDLNVSLCKRVGAEPKGGEHWASMLPSLQRFNLTGSSADDSALQLLATHSPRLRWLNVTRCATVGDTGVQAVAASCGETLLSVYLACTRVSDASLAALGKWCHGLRELHLSGCPEVGDGGILALVAGCRRLQVGTVRTHGSCSWATRLCPRMNRLATAEDGAAGKGGGWNGIASSRQLAHRSRTPPPLADFHC